MTEKFNYLSLPRITKFSLALYQKLISMGMHLILQSSVLVSKIAQFKSYAAGLYIIWVFHQWFDNLYSFLHPAKHGFLFILKNVLFKEINDIEIPITFSNKMF